MTTQEERFEKYILTQKELHFGLIKETFSQGVVIAKDKETGKLIVDGRTFDDSRDLDILKRQAVKHPDNPWIVPYSQEAQMLYVSNTPPVPKVPQPIDHMAVVQSDEDLMDDIDISHTKVAKKNQEKRDAARQRQQPETMEVIRGDETPEDRIARLNEEGKTDMKSIAERVALKSKTAAKMPIIRDDSLGEVGGSRASTLNAGQHITSREEVEAKAEEVALLAESRKKEIAQARAKAAELGGVDIGLLEAEMTPYPVTTPEVQEKDAQIAALEAQLAELKSSQVPTRVPVTDASQANAITGE